MKKGFTLIEVLVVVLIIGILSAISLPQYTKAMERSRTAEALAIVGNFRKAVDVYMLGHENASAQLVGSSATGSLDVDLDSSMDCASSGYCSSNYFDYDVYCSSGRCWIQADRKTGAYVLEAIRSTEGKWSYSCYTFKGDIGRVVCGGVEGQGWTYVDDAL